MTSEMTAITSIQDLRVGDIFLGPIGGLVGLGVGLGEFIVDGGFHVGTIDVRHAGIVVTAKPGLSEHPDYPAGILGQLELAQAMPGGAEITTMTYDRHWTDRCLWVRLPEDYAGQAEDAAEVARLMVASGVDYSPASYAAIALHRFSGGYPRLDAWIDRRQPGIPLPMTSGRLTTTTLPVEAICSVFVDQAWTLTGKQVIRGVAPQAVSPSRLAQSLLATDGAIFGWPVFNPWTPKL